MGAVTDGRVTFFASSSAFCWSYWEYAFAKTPMRSVPSSEREPSAWYANRHRVCRDSCTPSEIRSPQVASCSMISSCIRAVELTSADDEGYILRSRDSDRHFCNESRTHAPNMASTFFLRPRFRVRSFSSRMASTGNWSGAQLSQQHSLGNCR